MESLIGELKVALMGPEFRALVTPTNQSERTVPPVRVVTPSATLRYRGSRVPFLYPMTLGRKINRGILRVKKYL